MSTHPGTLYDYTAGTLCGVLVDEATMRKLAKLQTQHLEAVKRLLSDSDGVYPSMWTLHYPDGVQTTVRFIDTTRTKEQAIKNASVAHGPIACFPVFIAGSMDEAKQLADERHGIAA